MYENKSWRKIDNSSSQTDGSALSRATLWFEIIRFFSLVSNRISAHRNNKLYSTVQYSTVGYSEPGK